MFLFFGFFIFYSCYRKLLRIILFRNKSPFFMKYTYVSIAVIKEFFYSFSRGCVYNIDGILSHNRYVLTSHNFISYFPSLLFQIFHSGTNEYFIPGPEILAPKLGEMIDMPISLSISRQLIRDSF